MRAYVDEPDIGRLVPGEPIEITWDALPGRVWDGTVSNVPSTLKMHGTRNVGETTAIVDNKDRNLLPGSERQRHHRHWRAQRCSHRPA